MCRALIFILTSLFLFSNSALAIPAEGEFLPSLHNWIWGIQFNHIFRRDFNKVEGKASTTQYFIKTSYAITERFFLDAKAGWGGVKFKRKDQSKIDYPTNFAGGYGLRYLFYEDAKTGIKAIFGFQHISCHPHKREMENVTYKVIWDEWQTTTLFIKEWRKTAFYFGPQYSSAQLKYEVDKLRRRLKTEDSWGALAGCDYRFTKDTSVNVEARFFDEWALNFGVSYKF